MTVEPIHSTQQCLLCATPLERGARKCVKCGAFQDGLACVSCGSILPAEAVRCTVCKKVQRGVACRACGATLETGAKRCADCNSWQTLKRFVPESQITLAVLLSLISVCAAIVPPVYRYFSNHSQTYVRVIGAELATEPGEGPRVAEQTILVLVANNGKRPSMVKSARLTFTSSGPKTVDVEPADLEVIEFNSVLILPDTPVRLHLKSRTIGPRKGTTSEQVRAQVAAGGTATLTMTVEETDRNGEPFDAPSSHTFKAEKIEEWMNARVSSQ